jgi:hypothetical protein
MDYGGGGDFSDLVAALHDVEINAFEPNPQKGHMKGKFILYAVGVSLVTTLLSWTQFFSSLGPSKNSSGSAWSSRTGSGGGVWGGGTGGTWGGGGGGGHK